MSRYCCKTAEPPLQNCHWVGQGDCADNTCSAVEVTLRTDQQGDSCLGCLWSRRRALCCTPNGNVFDTPTCNKQLCEYEDSGFSCGDDPYGDDYSDEDQCEEGFCDESAARSLLEPRGKLRPPFSIAWQVIVGSIVRDFSLRLQMRGYPGASKLHSPTRSTPASNNAFMMERNNCRSTEIHVIDRRTLTAAEIQARFDTEHNPDGQYIRDLFNTMATGILPNGSATTVRRIDPQALVDNWNARVLPRSLPRAGSSQILLTPNAYLFDRLGSHGNRNPMVLCEKPINQMQGLIFNLKMPSNKIDDSSVPTNDDDASGIRPEPMPSRQFQLRLALAGRGDVASQNAIFDTIRTVIAVFNYINHPDALPMIQNNRRELRTALMLIAEAVPALRDAPAIHREFDGNWYREGADRAQACQWVAARILDIRLAFGELERNGELPPNVDEVRDILNTLELQIKWILAPPDIE